MWNETNTLFPVFLKLDNKQVLIIGGGNIALEKVTALLNNCPDVKIKLVAPKVLDSILEIAQYTRNLVIHQREFVEDDFSNVQIAISATGIRDLSKKIKLVAEKRGVLINVADTPDLCDFYLGSIVTKGDLKIAISTNGKSPTLAKRLREYLQQYITDDILVSINSLNRLRDKLKGDFSFKVKKLNEATEILLSKEEAN